MPRGQPKIPWYVRDNIPPGDVKPMLKRMPQRDPHYTREKWRRIKDIPFSFPSNTTLPCPTCGRYLHLSHITENAEAKRLRLSNLWTCLACNKTFFIGDFEDAQFPPKN